MDLWRWISSGRADTIPCRGCLGPLDEHSEAGLCGRCWSGLTPLPEERCPVCALVHESDSPCPEPCAWTRGDALWDYHGGRPGLGALLIPAIKDGELGWRKALLLRLQHTRIPDFASEVDIVTSVPGAFYRLWMRGFDLAEDAARILARRLGQPFQRTLSRHGFHGRQALKTEGLRRHLPRHTMRPRNRSLIEGSSILLVDDVWTTGTTLLRCAQALQDAGAHEIRVLTLFRSL